VVTTSGDDAPSQHAVLTAAESSLAARTANVALSMTMHVAVQGRTVDLTATGTGSVDFATGATDVSVTYGGLRELTGTQIREISTGGQVYVQFSGPAFASLGADGRWVTVPVGTGPGSADGGLSQSDPSGMLQALAADGDTVTPTGPSTVDGVAVDTYHVTIDKAAAERRVAGAGLPPAASRAAEQFLSGADLSMDVAVDPSGSTVRQVTVDLDASLGGLQATGSVVERFSDYGTPVSITPPPADQVVPLQQLGQQARAAAGSTA
jgi:hypothetical protein